MAKYPKADIPLFRIDGESSSNKMRLHYYSKRDYFSRMVESLLRCTAKIIFKKDIDIRIISENFDNDRYHVIYSVLIDDLRLDPESPPTMVAQTKKHGEDQLHDVEVEHQKEKLDHIRMEFGEEALPVNKFRSNLSRWKSSRRMLMVYKHITPKIPSSMQIGPEDFCEIFPYHIVFDSTMCLKQAGLQMQFIIQEFREDNENVTRHLDLVHPGRCEFNFVNIQKYITCPHVLKTKHNNLISDFSPGGAVLYFRGQMIEIANKHLMLYLCSPYVHNLDSLEHHGMHISDIPTHDVTKYLLQGSASIECFKRRTNRGDWLEGFLGSDGQPNFGDGDEDNYDHKFTMVPKGMADVMKTGLKVEGKMYRNCSILFCDMVQFSQMVRHCRPTEILTMLNDIHEKLNRLADTHDVFKVDIIGDAYVVVSGIPTPTHDHAEKIAKMAIAMISVSKITHSPYNYGGTTGARILLRIGLHSGDIIGGIINRPTPRFIIMGDNVVLTSRLESHGIPDRIHLSQSMAAELQQFKFEIEPRGGIEIRGYGRMYTFLLKENQAKVKDMRLGDDRQINKVNPSSLPTYQNIETALPHGYQDDVNPSIRLRHPRFMRPKSGINQ